jgi:hypothetical protein
MTKEKIRDALASVLGFKPVRTVRHKLLVISAHALLWGLFLILPLFIYRVRIPDIRFFYREIINKSFLIGLFYLNFYYLWPRFFQKKQWFNYSIAVVVALLAICAQQLLLEMYLLKTRQKKFERIYVTEPTPWLAKNVNSPGPGGELPAPAGETRAFVVQRAGYGFFAGAVTGNKQLADSVEKLLSSNNPGAALGALEAGVPPPLVRERFPRMAYILTLKDALSAGIVILLLSGFIKLAHTLFISEKQKKLLENERLNAELNFLKLQINPHFLFNTLNSIYSQAHFRSEQTEHSILKFSRIMRYVLYDSATEKIALSQDLEYISNYIDLQKLRLSKNITIRYDVTGPVNGLQIAPLLLITFIENAFKHGISYTAPSEVNIAIAVAGNALTLTVGNAITQSSRESSGGVGLINARRRLDVLYPGRHMLDVVENDHLYIVNLKIELDHES